MKRGLFAIFMFIHVSLTGSVDRLIHFSSCHMSKFSIWMKCKNDCMLLSAGFEMIDDLSFSDW
jgi:hypothetical protein